MHVVRCYSARVVAEGGSLGLVAVKVFQRLQLLDQRLVLVFQDGHAVLQTLDVLFLLPATLAGRLSVLHEADLPFARHLLSGAPCGKSRR